VAKIAAMVIAIAITAVAAARIEEIKVPAHSIAASRPHRAGIARINRAGRRASAGESIHPNLRLPAPSISLEGMDANDPAFPQFSVFDDPVRAAPDEGGPWLPTRGAGWVLRWAVVPAVLFASFVSLARFACTLRAEHSLARAAQAAALEATLPDATVESVSAAAQRRLPGLAAKSGALTIHLEQNGVPVGGALRPRQSDRWSVTLAVPRWAVLPGWLRVASGWQSERTIEVRAERRVPGRAMP
jgi:hypothetical protein